MLHHRPHFSNRTTWLRASVLGANDGIISTTCLLIGIASANASKEALFIAGCIGLLSGAFSMAAGEFVSVSSQTDLENADLAMEQRSIAANFAAETQELAEIYQQRGLSTELAEQVARQLMAKDPLAAHARDDIGISLEHRVNPFTAALSSALAFVVGALLPIIVLQLSSSNIIAVLAITSVISLAALGALSAYLGKAPIAKAILRVTLWGCAAMSLSAYVGTWFN